MSDAVWLAFIAILPASIVALVPLFIRRSEKAEREAIRAEDKASLEEAARKVAEVAEQAREAARIAAETANLLAKNTAIAVEATKVLTDKVDVVHTLVNSNLTIATQKLREAKQRAVALLIKYTPKNHHAEIDALKIEITELDAVLADRLTQTKIAEHQQQRS